MAPVCVPKRKDVYFQRSKKSGIPGNEIAAQKLKIPLKPSKSFLLNGYRKISKIKKKKEGLYGPLLGSVHTNLFCCS